jgi:SMC interacting uncharacterized protein involved in chromosome segregation
VSDIQDQEQYIKSLEQIKQIEEAVQKEINERKEEVQNQIKAIEADLEDTIAMLKMKEYYWLNLASKRPE